MNRVSALLALLSIASATAASAADWPRFRGPAGDGVSADTNIPTQWSETENLKWKLALPGAGFSSPIVVGDRVLVTAHSGSGSSVQRHLVCVNRQSGEVLWKDSVAGSSDGGDGGFAYHGQASHTPVSDGENVYVMFGSSGVLAYDLAGKQLWKQDVGNSRASRFGTSSSPILHGDHVIVTAGAESRAMYALNKKTGEQVWKSEADSLSGSYSTPTIAADAEGNESILISVTQELWGLNPESGKLRWYAETRVDTAACPSILVSDGIAYVIGGRRGGRTAVKIGGKGDVTSSNVWSASGGSYVPSPVLHQGRLYWINDSGVANCVDAKTGEEVAKKRIGGKFYSSIVLIDGKLYAVSRFDGTYVLKASPEFEQIAKNKPLDDSDFSGSPAVSDGQLFIRSEEALYCITKP